jgi:site-specific DNA recombinase
MFMLNHINAHSIKTQVKYYTSYISGHPDYEYAGIYADEGISGTTLKRESRMIEDCKAGKIDMVITKSISRVARNTLDCLNFVRMLKNLGIGVISKKRISIPWTARGKCF